MSPNPNSFSLWTRRFFWLAIILLAAVVVVGIFFVFNYLQGRGLAMDIKGPDETNIGAPFVLTVEFSNQSRNILKNAQLNLNLPDGSVAVGEPQEKRVLARDLGDIGIGSLSSQTFNLLITGDVQASLARFAAVISYGSSAIGQARFEQRQNFDLKIKEPAVSLNITSPDQILSGNKFDIKIDYQNVSQETVSGLTLQIDYPASYSLASAKPGPTSGNNVWQLADLNPNGQRSIAISGSLIGPSDSFFNFGFKIIGNGNILINQKSASLKISPSPLALSVSVNNQANYIAQLGDQLVYTISYQNNSGVGLADVVIKAKLSGGMFDFSTLQSNANFNSVANTLTWNASNAPYLKVLGVGDSGSVTFQIRAKSQFPIKRLGDKNFSLKADAEIDSPTVPPALSASKTSGLAGLETKIAGQIQVAGKAYFRDAISGIVNYGPWPPRANQPTQYTVHWRITNYATDVSNVEVRAFLESGVRFTGQVRSNADSSPTYNDRTQEVVWTIGHIPATKGVISTPLEAIFQIEATPNITQIGNYEPLIKETTISASDDFTGQTLQNQSAGISTVLPDDPTVSQIKGIVNQ